jgi:hypothetical protein
VDDDNDADNTRQWDAERDNAGKMKGPLNRRTRGGLGLTFDGGREKTRVA